MGAEHTPGPWDVREYEGDDGIEFSVERQIEPLLVEEIVRVVDEADARLIAAAPELLEKAEQAWDTFIDLNRASKGEHDQAMEDLRAAIAKARGHAE